MTETAEEKRPSRKRKNQTEEVLPKRQPKRAAKTKIETARAETSTSKTKQKKTENKKSKSAATKIPTAKSFLASARELKIEISRAQLEDGKADTKTDNTEPTKPLGNAETAQTTKSNDEINDKKVDADDDKKAETNNAENGITTLFLLTAKPQKFKTGSYGWNANQAKANVTVVIDGKPVELSATINLNITVHSSKQ
uniref:Uncharacterized protein n=1 Tax=Anthurium amnicola TaxID=1678845 RepID=A0A1D1ZDQ5_9ARAE